MFITLPLFSFEKIRSYTNVKMSLIAAGVNPLTLAAMDSGFMFTYAGGSFVTGMLGDRFSPVAVIAGGLLGSTLCLFLIILGASTSIVHSIAICGTYFLSCQLLHGLFQATGGPVSPYFKISPYLTLNIFDQEPSHPTNDR